MSRIRVRMKQLQLVEPSWEMPASQSSWDDTTSNGSPAPVSSSPARESLRTLRCSESSFGGEFSGSRSQSWPLGSSLVH